MKWTKKEKLPTSKLNSRNLHEILKDDGRLVILDFYRDPSKMTSHPPEWAYAHLRADKSTFRKEIESCGFRYVSDIVIENMGENYVMIFQKIK